MAAPAPASARDEPHRDIEYRAVRVAPTEREHAIVNVLRYFEARGAIVFCSTREAVRQLHGNLLERGFRVAALLDADPARVGEQVGELTVDHIDDLDRVVKEEQVAIGIIATPAQAAQEVCDRLVAAGVTSILNFAPAHVQVPAGVSLRKVDLSTELQILSFHEQRRAAVDLVRQVAARHRDTVAGRGPEARD